MPRLTVDCLVVLDAIAHHGSFAAAGEALHRVPSAVSYSVQKLEQDLGCEVFDRSGHRARLTQAGSVLLAEGREVLRRMEELERRVQRVADGWETKLRIVVSDVLPRYALHAHLAAFYTSGAPAGTTLTLAADAADAGWEMLQNGEADLLIGAHGEGPPDERIETRRMGELPLALVARPDHAPGDARGLHLAPSRVPAPAPRRAAPDPTSPRCTPAGLRLVVTPHQARGPAPLPSGLVGDVLVVQSIADQREAVCAGLGVALLPDHVIADDLACGRLIRMSAADTSTLDLCIAWRGDQVGKALAWFLQRFATAPARAGLLPAVPDVHPLQAVDAESALGGTGPTYRREGRASNVADARLRRVGPAA
jgi:DNA-binding transcriptional LysR family regulator